ncbi:hypothetical protein C5B42_05860 [Candidatus Cerribacteria bacterium 'Amazon FNV 2010 28 9']|uniref:SH3b domain-containing protein n=1 Tax=Candidatus Cerribacteria bacterium 'Amazon FNV 2010 28 9' TaxID=2081795 RepID=A0A317JMX9_9BACT|nr:MAG: hypothetical protein C5B42_05860 [Candidatus Cerribacteria bacterium 'Amazon FNV 2010 28 9']
MRVRTFIIVGTTSLFLSGCTLFKHPTGGIKITSNVSANVFLDTDALGMTPVDKQPVDVKTYTLKMVPSDSTLAAYQGSLAVTSGFQTTVNWTFAQSQDQSSGLIIESDVAHTKNAAELEIVTTPDNVPVSIDGENKGFSPLVLDTLDEGSYTLGFSAPGFSPLNTTIRLVKGLRLVVTAKLGRAPVTTASASALLTTPVLSPTPTVIPQPTSSSKPSATPKPIAKPYVLILTTPTGFLRVRSAPDSTASEIGRLNTGDMAPYLKTSNNWFNIKFSGSASSSGWVSGQYAKLVQ